MPPGSSERSSANTNLHTALGTHQFLSVKTFALQWLFAFVIMSILIVLTVPLAIAHLLGRQAPIARGTIVNEDRERQPLLDGQESGATNNSGSLFG